MTQKDKCDLLRNPDSFHAKIDPIDQTNHCIDAALTRPEERSDHHFARVDQAFISAHTRFAGLEETTANVLEIVRSRPAARIRTDQPTASNERAVL